MGIVSRFGDGMLSGVRVRRVVAVRAVGAGKLSVELGWWRQVGRVEVFSSKCKFAERDFGDLLMKECKAV